MSLFSRNNPSNRAIDWKKAEGVLPVERALADEHEAMHGEDITGAMETVPVEFDPPQFVDIPAMARDLRASLGAEDLSLPHTGAPRVKLDDESTPRDAVGRFLLSDADLLAALDSYEKAAERKAGPAANAFAAALTARFNALLGMRLMDVQAFRSFVEAGSIDALGEPLPGVTADDAQKQFVRRANRELIEAAFPHLIALMRDRRLATVFDKARLRDTSALCLSGGGIRSSTFALGVMQGLAKHGLLGKFDYLSTVSGGGLSGGWLTGWMRRDGAKAVHEALRQPGREKLQPEPEPLQGLRAFSHWLTPNASAMSIDSWTVIATVIRNLLLNWLVLLPLLAGIVMIPRLLLAALAAEHELPSHPARVAIAGLMLGFVLLSISSGFVERVRTGTGDLGSGRRDSATPQQFLYLFFIPRIIGSAVTAFAFYHADHWDTLRPSYEIMSKFMGALIVMGVVAMLIVFVMGLRRRGRHSRWHALGRAAIVIFCGWAGYFVAFFVLDGFAREMYVTFGTSALLLGSVGSNQLYTGLTSNESSDAEREWAARANAWVIVAAIVWSVSSAVVLFGPQLIAGLWQKLTVIGVGGVSSWLTIVLSKQSTTPTTGKPSIGARIASSALSLAMPAVVFCIIIGLAAANEGTLNLVCRSDSLSRQLHCNPPTEDSTSVPMLREVEYAKSEQASVARTELQAKLAADIPRVPVSATERDSSRVADSTIVAASHALTAATLSRDSMATRLIRRAGAKEGYSLDESDSLNGVLQSFRKFTLARNNHFESVSEQKVVPPELLFRAVEHALDVDTALKTDIERRSRGADSVQRVLDSVNTAKTHHQPSENALALGVLVLMVIMILAGVLFSTRVNTNTFSLHAMWRSRTVRAFLGTTRASSARNPNPFTGFDSQDDLPMRDLWPARVNAAEAGENGNRSEEVPPMHVLNVTLNLNAGRNLAWQQRKGESMTLTPLHAGSAFTGYRRMEPHPKPTTRLQPAKPGYGGASGVSLGTAMAISGAAASPNDGSGTTALGAFLMTFFNARLGWWLGNPGAPGANTWKLANPKSRLTPILSEMFGLTSDRSEYVYLSDGGHFENLALYEMVFRRCRFIVLSDAGADPDYTFEDLGNAVRKIRIDFGIPIEFDQPVNIRSGDGTKGAYWATAKIRYSAIDMPPGCTPDDYDGVLVYLKPAVYGTIEPRDVINYANLSPTFPQESSADQFFSESQFESYRALGSWIVDQLVANPGAPGEPATAKGHREGSLLSSWPNIREAPVVPKY